MANPALGLKQICPTCSTKFYDLNRRPAHCPHCGAEFDPEEALRNRRVKARVSTPDEEVEEEKVVAAPPEGEEVLEAEVEEAPELDQVPDETPLVVDEDEEDVAEPDVSAPPAPEALGVDFAEEDDIEEADDDEVPFIEDEDDEFSSDEIEGLPSGSEEE
ncbi:MAG: TIGR02300 family protein, partial [Caulobacteraceae bacterium]